MDATLKTPLLEEEICELDAFLMSDATSDESMDHHHARWLSDSLGDRAGADAAQPMVAARLEAR
jgi:hypothetical protein